MHHLDVALPGRSAVRRAAEYVVTAAANPREPVEAVFERLGGALRQKGGTLVALYVYGDIAARAHCTTAMRRHLGAIDWPVLWIEGRSCNGALLAGAQAFAVSGAEVERVRDQGAVVGSVYADADARQGIFAGLRPDNLRGSRHQQALETLQNLDVVLRRTGFEFGDIARTWFYNEKLLDWYADFNRVRTAFYATRPFRSGSLPASTGVAAANPAGAALAVGAWAVRPLSGCAIVREVASPRQCPAPSYGSSFSRAVEIVSGGKRRLSISGTASIGVDGRSLWAGDVARQIATTMDVVEAILAERGLALNDTTRATAYFKYPLDVAAFEVWEEGRGVRLPVVCVHCDICRDDLLFELELDACAGHRGAAHTAGANA